MQIDVYKSFPATVFCCFVFLSGLFKFHHCDSYSANKIFKISLEGKYKSRKSMRQASGP